ncbi:MAG: HAD-IA family hydrolase [Lysobacteraceae bacterium]
MSHPALLLFDLDGVLARYDHAARLAVLAERSGASVEAVSAALFESGLEADSDLGRYDAAGQVEELSRRLQRPIRLDDCIDARAAAMRIDAEVMAMAKAASRRCSVAIFTNNGLLLRDNLRTILPPLFPLFEGRVRCSAEFGVGKPEATAFQRCLESLGFAAVDTLFIDDKLINMDGARRAGLHAHHFRDAAALADVLVHHRLLGEDDHAL